MRNKDLSNIIVRHPSYVAPEQLLEFTKKFGKEGHNDLNSFLNYLDVIYNEELQYPSIIVNEITPSMPGYVDAVELFSFAEKFLLVEVNVR